MNQVATSANEATSAPSDQELHMQTMVKSFRQNGVVLLQEIYSAEQMEKIRGPLGTIALNSTHGQNSLKKRNVINLKIEGELNSESLYANQSVLGSIMAILPRRYLMLTSFCASISGPHTPEDRINYGHKDLFKLNDKKHLIRNIPPFEVILIAALKDIAPEGGELRVWPASHLSPSASRPTTVDQSQFIDVSLRKGDCILIDSRLAHQFLANSSSTSAEYLIVRYSIPWFRNIDADTKLPSIQLTEEEFERVDPPVRFLLDHARGKIDWTQQTFIKVK